jgi:uncharacterized protein (TIGR02266 family)
MPREQERIPLNLDVELDSSSGKYEVRISDISLGGCYVDTIAPAAEGEPVKLKIKMPESGDTIVFTGTVAYSMERFGFGVRFTDLTDQQKAFLESVMGPKP